MRAFRGTRLRKSIVVASPSGQSLCGSLMKRWFRADQRTKSGIKDAKEDRDALRRFTSGRWLWREQEQLACRYVRFELRALLDIAASFLGAQFCTRVLKLAEGQYNKVFLLTMNDGRECIAKLPNPNAGRPHFTTASEVATMDFLRNVLELPVPQVYAWSSRAAENPVGAEFILMEKQPGVMLSDVWDSLKGKSRAQLVLQVVDLEKTLAATKFTGYGALYYKKDSPPSRAATAPLYVDSNRKTLPSDKFVIGPTNHRAFFDFGRGSLDIDRGPWTSATELVTAVANREIATTRKGLKYPLMPEGLFRGPRQYQPNTAKKLATLNNYLRVAASTLPENPTSHASVLWHGDLNLQNIFVDPAEPTRITGIIDWQSTSLSPLFTQVTRPAFLEYNGPLPESLDKVPLPVNFDSLSPADQRDAKALHQAQTLHNLYLARSLQVNPAVFDAIQGHRTLRHQVSVLPGLTIMDYEPCLADFLRDVQKQWPDIVGRGPDGALLVSCPLQFSVDEVRALERDAELWARGVALMEEFISDTGCFKHWDGRVSVQDYELSRKQLDDGVERFLRREARSDEKRREWLEVLPFVD
ncbi:aminoglycoside phosphotransferase family protein [Aspergillus homomorphus CBS 101889]|uniref:Putative mitochondrial protein Fmp29 n=1 Tax=Aspergillus homomorphus (strain CBS 101889) TaxID=1450537 RepID=A0A395HGT3_ASPHC|nr:putative mitochondrial protein Fmp29 [Aspergillus homomorphus CBS 101889]RAL07047.1 putative mitochondrial protein Fmp29 [Aspergillus homomorphus CBS 101889]